MHARMHTHTPGFHLRREGALPPPPQQTFATLNFKMKVPQNVHHEQSERVYKTKISCSGMSFTAPESNLYEFERKKFPRMALYSQAGP